MKSRLLIIMGIVLVSISLGSFAYAINVQNQCESNPGYLHYPRPTTFWNCLEYLKMIQENTVPEIAPEPTPQLEHMSEKIPHKKNFMPPEEFFQREFGNLIIESEFDDVINYKPVKLDSSEIEFNGQKIILFEIRINANTNINYLYGPQTMKLDELKNKQAFFDDGGIVIETVYMPNSNEAYARLVNDPSFEIEYLGTVPTRYYFYPEEYNSLLLYPENERLVYIQSTADIDEIKQLASSLKLKNDSLNLNDYRDSNWRLLEPTPES